MAQLAWLAKHGIEEVLMFILRALAVLSLVAATVVFFDGALSRAGAQEELSSMSCGDLWYRRNAIFARNGYCFKTDRAIRVFGNEGCRFYVEGDVPMSRAEREEVEIIRAIERRKGCEA
jgi:hypothetical protein